MFGGNYNVKLRVGIFPKKGKLELRVMDGNLVSGYLDIFNNRIRYKVQLKMVPSTYMV